MVTVRMKTFKKDKQTMNCLCSTVSKGEELAWGVIEGETLPERPGKRFEPESSYPGLLATLILTVKMKDIQLYIHSRRVQHYAHLFTRALNLTHEQAQMIELGLCFMMSANLPFPMHCSRKRRT